MSTFAVFGMTAPTTKPNPTPSHPPLEISLGEWNLAVDEQAIKIMRGEKVRQLSQPFDTPQFAEKFVTLTKKHRKCRSLRVRAKCPITDTEGNPVITQKTKAPKVGWVDYSPAMTAQIACSINGESPCPSPTEAFAAASKLQHKPGNRWACAPLGSPRLNRFPQQSWPTTTQTCRTSAT